MEDRVPRKTPDPVLWTVGDWRPAEFAEAIAWLKANTWCLWFDSAAAALARGRSDDANQVPIAILLIQSRPGQISRGDVERLHAAAPLARLVALVGAWWEGESRSGLSLPGLVRVPVSLWRYRLAQELGLSGDKGGAVAVLPRTLTAGERIEADITRLPRDRSLGGLALVAASCRASYEAIADMVATLGMRPVWLNAVNRFDNPVDLLVFDGWEQVAASSAYFADIKAPRVLLTHFPRHEDFERARQEKIGAVIGHPLIFSDLAQAIASIRSAPAGVSTVG